MRQSLISRFQALHRAYRQRTEATLTVETVLVLPLLVTAITMTYSYFAAFEQKAIANKAAYTISDYLSRQTVPINADFIDGLEEIYRFLNNVPDARLRVTSVRRSQDWNKNEYYKLIWSYASNGGTVLTQDTLASVEDRLPTLALGEEFVIVEVSRDWQPIFKVGLGTVTFGDFVVTKPRFAPKVVFEYSDGRLSS
ncbi:TadE/TadG family type IV pilus assembly protein [Celeribacter indicus]|uniref:Flp pilus assembly protein TadG n=1 Tax=Celeribacter indicus TaxID=1208324 RepID=A0A0B5DX52_9RHOB|nr:hypothetical protein [Celeribacter indicus]AJE48033.1 hypothetical protein P73_3318 [Celeribacter indicus]SDW30058.1 hypothetical protein SAMN05443573_102311 [Celeribacter indicus]